METHAHELHKAPGHGWKHYFFEFFMLFLAVFCGYLAENLREHIIEHKRAKDYALGLFKDLQRDTSDLKKGIIQQRLANNYADSLCLFVKDPGAFKESGKLFMYLRLSYRLYGVEWNKATINQLLNSGNLRYFNNQELTNKISEYNTLCEMITNRDEIIIKHRLQEREVWGKIFNANAVNNLMNVHLLNDNPQASKQYDSLKNIQVPLVSRDFIQLNEYVMKAMTYRSTTNSLAEDLYPHAVNLATEIMEMLTKEYTVNNDE